MCRARLIERVGAVDVVGPAQAPGWRHRFNKLGHDGTGKGNIEPGDEHVWGVVSHPFPVHVARIGLSREGTPRWRWWVGPYFWKAGALAVVLAAALAPASAYACQCKVSGVREAIDRAESVFIARPREAGPEGLMLVDVVRAFKGRITAGTQTVVATESKSDCPSPMAFVDEHGVLVSKEPVLFYGSADQQGRVAPDREQSAGSFLRSSTSSLGGAPVASRWSGPEGGSWLTLHSRRSDSHRDTVQPSVSLFAEHQITEPR